MTNTKFTMLVALILLSVAAVTVTVIESTREPAPQRAAQHAVEYLGAMIDETDAATLITAHNRILVIEVGLKLYQVEPATLYDPECAIRIPVDRVL